MTHPAACVTGHVPAPMLRDRVHMTAPATRHMKCAASIDGASGMAGSVRQAGPLPSARYDTGCLLAESVDIDASPSAQGLLTARRIAHELTAHDAAGNNQKPIPLPKGAILEPA